VLGGDPISFAVVFSAGLVSFASPCVLPLVPAYIGFVSGVGLSDQERPRRRDVALPTVAFVAGFSLMFAALGASVGLAGSALLEQRRALEIAGGILVVAMGLILLGRGVPMLLMRERRFHLARRPATLVGSGLAGSPSRPGGRCVFRRRWPRPSRSPPTGAIPCSAPRAGWSMPTGWGSPSC